jgi:phosphoglycolate phosphatase
MKKRVVLFDLDGTVTDPKAGITRSVRYSLESFGITVEDPDSLTAFIGPPLAESFKKLYGFDDAQAERAIAKYREYFAPKGIFENTLYDGMDVLLRRLSEKGVVLAIATSKPAVFAERILSHFEIDAYFSFVSGSELDGRRVKKGEVIRYALDTLGLSSPESAVMVGDREHDVIGARENGVESVGVTYGYGSLQELTGAKATYIAGSVAGLSELLDNIT